jgi:hypothetical protein
MILVNYTGVVYRNKKVLRVSSKGIGFLPLAARSITDNKIELQEEFVPVYLSAY